MPKETSTAPLAQWYVICLRPLNLHAGVRRAAAKLGVRTFALSTLRIVPRAAGDCLANALACPHVLVTSPAAVRMAQAQRPLLMRPGQQWFAPGTGTAAALRRCGIRHVLTPADGADSAALLAHRQLQEIRGQRIAVISAPGGRGLLEKTLRERGADVVVAHVYSREQLSVPKTRIAALLALPHTSALLVSSGEAFDVLWRQLNEQQREGLRRRPVVASSDRLLQMLRQHGFTSAVLAADARPENLLAALATHVSAGRFR